MFLAIFCELSQKLSLLPCHNVALQRCSPIKRLPARQHTHTHTKYIRPNRQDLRSLCENNNF